MPLSASVVATVASQYTGTKLVEAVGANIAANLAVVLASGTGQGQAAVQWADRRTLLTGASENLDLSGTLVDALGNTINLTKIKGLIIQADPGNTTNLTVGNVANGIATIFGAATQSFVLQPGELFIKMTPDATAYAITLGTADLLKVANAAGASATYTIIVFGV